MPIKKQYKGKPVYDAKIPLVVNVKEEDVRRSRRKDPTACAVARCLIRDKIVESVRIGVKVALIEYSSHFERYQVSLPTRREVKDFDRTGAFTTGKYELLPICKSLRLTGKAHSKVHKRKHSGPSGGGVIRKFANRNMYKAREVLPVRG